MVPLTIYDEDAVIVLNNITHFWVYDYWLTGFQLLICIVDSWLIVLNLVGTIYRLIFFHLLKMNKIIVMLHANCIAGALCKYKFESSETPTRTGTVSVNCSVYCRSNDDWTRKVFRSWRNISSDGVSRSRIAVQCAFSVICSAVTQKPKVQHQHGACWVTIIMLGQRK